MPEQARSWWPWVLGGAALLALAFVAGRYSNPTRIEERVRVQLVEKQVVVVQERVRVETVTVEKVVVQTKVVTREVTRPDGSVERTRTEEAQATSDSKHQAASVEEKQGSSISTSSGTSDVAKVAAYAIPSWRVGVTAGVRPFEAWRPVYGGEAGYRVAGPFWLGVGVTSALEVRGSLGVEF